MLYCRTIILILVAAVLFSDADFAASQVPQSGTSSNLLVIKSLVVAGKKIPISIGKEQRLSAFPERLEIHFGRPTEQTHLPTRVRFKLIGHENDWQIGEGFMGLLIRFYDKGNEQIGQKWYNAYGESANWHGSFEHSALAHRREGLVVPPHASKMMAVISSAGPPATEGVYVVANLTISKVLDKSAATVLLRSPFDNQTNTDENAEPPGWVRDGLVRNMAKIVKIGPDPTVNAFAIIDNDPQGHAEWRNDLDFAPHVTPGDNLVVEWNEMFSIGVEDSRVAIYDNVAPGRYLFEVDNIDLYGVPTGEKAELSLVVLPPFWQTSSFWLSIFFLTILAVFGASRYAASQKLRRQMVRMKNQEAMERERIRIAQDIHDDLGARVTQISLISAMAHTNSEYSEKARADFGQITRFSRELVAALYETVWAVNPENDNLYALGDYVCQMVNQLCEPVQFRCRFNLTNLPRNVLASSQVRHNITMAVKEAVHNTIKHAKASEVTVNASFEGGVLTISISDNGQGFRESEKNDGHGLGNMKKRLEEIGGDCNVRTEIGKGTTVTMTLKFQSSNQAKDV